MALNVGRMRFQMDTALRWILRRCGSHIGFQRDFRVDDNLAAPWQVNHSVRALASLFGLIIHLFVKVAMA